MVVPPVSPSRVLQLPLSQQLTSPQSRPNTSTLSGHATQLGVVNVTAAAPTTPAGIVGAGTVTSSGSGTLLLHQQQSELQVARSVQQQPSQQHQALAAQLVSSRSVQQPQQQATVTQLTLPVSTVSASGGTIHHLGQSPPRGGIPPLVNPLSQQQRIVTSMNVQQLQQALQQQQIVQQVQGLLTPTTSQSPATPQTQSVRRNSGTLSPGASPRPNIIQASPLLGSLGALNSQSTNRTSPVNSPDRPRKRIKLEEKPAATTEVANYRKLICDEKLKQIIEVKENYREHLTELFFLQNGGNIMEYFNWKKRPTPQLLNFLKTGNLDSDDEEEIGQEKKINDEVRIQKVCPGADVKR